MHKSNHPDLLQAWGKFEGCSRVSQQQQHHWRFLLAVPPRSGGSFAHGNWCCITSQILATSVERRLPYKAYGVLLVCCMICLSLMPLSSQQHIPLARSIRRSSSPELRNVLPIIARKLKAV